MAATLSNRAKGKRKTQDPCEGCFFHRDRCICEFIPKIIVKTKLNLIIHAKELKRTTNTGVLATKALVNSAVHVRGRINEKLDFGSILLPEYRSVLFYPGPDAISLTSEFVHESPLPINLIVPDGNWRQASKVHYRYQELKDLPRVMIKTPNVELFHLRAESKEEGMATLQAIAMAFGIIEGESVKVALMKLYYLKLERTLLGRGTPASSLK
jgi:DTW domain-containing protein YfiP